MVEEYITKKRRKELEIKPRKIESACLHWVPGVYTWREYNLYATPAIYCI